MYDCNMRPSLLSYIHSLLVVAVVFMVLITIGTIAGNTNLEAPTPMESESPNQERHQATNTDIIDDAYYEIQDAASEPILVQTETETPASTENSGPSPQIAQAVAATTQEPLYTTPPLQFETINTMTLPALVNILCASKQGSNIPGATGSGIIIDPRGVILTNAHVAQYLLLAQHASAPVSCVVRIGAPAKPRFTADVLAFPRVWAEQHAKDILTELPTGTGEHDWALLYITGTTSGVPKPDTFPFISFDTRHAVTQTHDPVLLASYPAGFLGSIALRKDLWSVSTIVSIQKVFTFTQGIIDVLSLGGNIAAQGGSSGGAVVNQWGHVVGLIVTSSLGDTTAERDLRAVTLSHIEQSLHAQVGEDLLPFLQQGDFESRVQTFKANSLPYLLEYYSL